jgi:hypothetical protein
MDDSLSCRSMEGKEGELFFFFFFFFFFFIPEGSDGKGWLNCWVEMQRLKCYYEKQR